MKQPSARLIAAVTSELGLPDDYFIESQFARIADRLAEDGRLRAKVYRMVSDR